MSIGQAISRVDGPLKVTGRAKYAADQRADRVLHAVLVTAPIAAGRVVSIDTAPARTVGGVERVITAADMPRLEPPPVPPCASTFLPMQGDEIRHEGQPVAIVLAETLEAAEEAARRVKAKYKRTRFKRAERGASEKPAADTGYSWGPADFRKGRARKATHTHEAEYTQPSRHHNPIEISATLARWDDGALTVQDATQHVYGVRDVMAAVFGLAPEKVRVLCPHTGGGFGCKGFVWPHEILAAAAAKIVERPVRLALTRAQMYANVGYQPRIVHKVALGADAKGKLTRLKHEAVNQTSVSDDFMEMATTFAKGVYATPALQLAQRVERANVNLPTPMRAPVEGPGSWALESAMDELAHAIGMDPLDLRLANYAETDPGTGKPWSSKKLREAYEEGARLFGWRERAKMPRCDGHWLVGHGMATSSMGNFRFPSEAKVRLKADGSAIVETGTQDIGTGTLTIFPQIAAEVLGLGIDKVELRMGDSALTQGGPTYGSSSTMGVGSAVLRAAEEIRSKLARLANLPVNEVEMRDGRIRRTGGAGEGIAIADVLREAGKPEIAGHGKFTLPGEAESDDNGGESKFAMRTFGVIFVEVGVDPELGLLRLRRAVGAYSAGRIINPKTARSQMIGGIIWGWGMAAMEASRHEPTLGRWLSKDLAGVALPVNADVPADIAIHFVDEFDPHASPLGARGIGELSATGVAAAVANAVFHATGKRIRDLPITPAKLVAA
jgi:xanthine dehydrogenase YagR molybdenum-binding subunit